MFQHTSQNLMYAGPLVISFYHNAKRYEHNLDDETGRFAQEIADMEFFLSLLDELYYKIRDIPHFDSITKGSLTQYRVLYSIWLCIANTLNSTEIASEITKLNFYFDYRAVSNKSYKDIRHIEDEMRKSIYRASVTKSYNYEEIRRSTYFELATYIEQRFITDKDKKKNFLDVSKTIYEYHHGGVPRG